MNPSTRVHLKDGETVDVPFRPDSVKHWISESNAKGWEWLSLNLLWLPVASISYLEALPR